MSSLCSWKPIESLILRKSVKYEKKGYAYSRYLKA